VAKRRFDSELLTNIFLRYQKNGFSFGAGVFDLFDEQHDFIQVAGDDLPLPGGTREFYVKASYNISFD